MGSLHFPENATYTCLCGTASRCEAPSLLKHAFDVEIGLRMIATKFMGRPVHCGRDWREIKELPDTVVVRTLSGVKMQRSFMPKPARR
jgi:hypothetical protein